MSKRSQFIKGAPFFLILSSQVLSIRIWETQNQETKKKINKSRVQHYTLGCYYFMGIHVLRVSGSDDDRACMSANIFVWCFFFNCDLMSDSRNLLNDACFSELKYLLRVTMGIRDKLI